MLWLGACIKRKKQAVEAFVFLPLRIESPELDGGLAGRIQLATT